MNNSIVIYSKISSNRAFNKLKRYSWKVSMIYSTLTGGVQQITIKINKIWKFKVVGCFKMKGKLVGAVHDGGLTKNWRKVAHMSSSKFSYTKSKTCMRDI